MRRSKSSAIALAITLFLIGLLFSACVPQSSIDQIVITNNDSGDDAIVLVDGDISSGCSADQPYRGQANISLNEMVSTGSCNAEVVVFSDDDRVELAAASAWPTSADTLSIPLGDMHVLPVNIWIVHAQASNRQTYLTNAINQVNRSLQLYNDMDSGIAFQITYREISDSSNVDMIKNLLQGISDSITAGAPDCTRLQITGNPNLYVAGEINVYFANLSGNRAFACDDDFIGVSPYSDNESLAHEFGHLLTLGHVTQSSGNLMKSGGVFRTHFTIGQAFRMSLNGGSALNALGVRSGPERNCPHNTVSSICPAVLFDVIPR